MILLLMSGMVSCSSARLRESVTTPPPAPAHPPVSDASEMYGPFPSGEAIPIPAPSGSAERIEDPDRIVLVFGRGLAHGYAYLGVLRALHELKVSVHAIYATEVGALAAALYFTQPNPNRIDWALLRFNEKNLGGSGSGFSLRLNSREVALEDKLREVFGERRIEGLSEKIHIGLEDAKTGESLEAKSGELWRALRGALAGGNGFSDSDFEGRPVRASGRKLSESYRLARQSETYPVVVVAAGEPPTELFRKLVEDQKSTLVYVPLPGIDNLDLKKRNQALFSGKNAVHKAAAEILGLVGRKLE